MTYMLVFGYVCCLVLFVIVLFWIMFIIIVFNKVLLVWVCFLFAPSELFVALY